MATIKKPFKIFNKAANTWNKYHLETDSTQVTHTKADGTDTTVAEQLLALNSTLTTLSANLGSTAGVSAKCFYNSFICEVRIEGKTTTTFPNWGGYRLGILPEKARPKQNIVAASKKSNIVFPFFPRCGCYIHIDGGRYSPSAA